MNIYISIYYIFYIMFFNTLISIQFSQNGRENYFSQERASPKFSEQKNLAVYKKKKKVQFSSSLQMILTFM